MVPEFASPGFVAQGGSLSKAADVAGRWYHGIIGRGITQAKDIRTAKIRWKNYKEHTK